MGPFLQCTNGIICLIERKLSVLVYCLPTAGKVVHSHSLCPEPWDSVLVGGGAAFTQLRNAGRSHYYPSREVGITSERLKGLKTVRDT